VQFLLIWVYDNGVLVNDKPNRLQLLLQQMQAIGYSPTSVAGRRTIDTGKAVGVDIPFILSLNPFGVKYL
jgi:hypothetical protein